MRPRCLRARRRPRNETGGCVVSRRSVAEDWAVRYAQRRVLWWVLGSTAGWMMLGLILIMGVATVAVLGGGRGLAPASNASAAGRVVSWAAEPAIQRAPLPNPVVLAVMAHESHGRVWATNYNCSNGHSARAACVQVYPGTHTLSEDAGLMQVNSGGWPVPLHAPAWQALGLASNPFDPSRNIAAGVQQLTADWHTYRYLQYALEAYNSGRGGPSSAARPYADAVHAVIQQLQSGPTLEAWTVGETRQGQGVVSRAAPAWLLVSAVGPYGRSYRLPWAPGVASCAKPAPGAAHCRTQPELLMGKTLIAPRTVTANGRPLAWSPAAAPLWRGQAAWAALVTRPGVYTIVATWPNGHTARTRITLGRA